MTSTYRQKSSKNNSDRTLASCATLQANRLLADLPTEGSDVDRFDPPTEIRESDYSFSIYIDLPGLRAQDINITSCTTSITIHGQRRSPQSPGQILKSELAVGLFEKVVQLPSHILGEQVYAEYSHGVLRLEIPKQLSNTKQAETCQTIAL